MTRYVAKFTFSYIGYLWSSDEAELIGQQIAGNLRADFLGIE